MISYFKTVGSELTRLSKPEPGCWVSVVEPTPDEVNVLIEQYGLDRDFVRSSLDEEESSRVEREENQKNAMIRRIRIMYERGDSYFVDMML